MTQAAPMPASPAGLPRFATEAAPKIRLDSVVSLSAGAATDVDQAVRLAAESLLRKQREVHWSQMGGVGRVGCVGGVGGERGAEVGQAHGTHWCAELEGDSILSSEYILMKFILSQEAGAIERVRLPRIANQIRLSQRADGSWGQYPGSAPDISACVKSYLALKLMGDDVNAPHMARAREVIRTHGGAEACNTFSTFYLACLGIVSWDACPAIPPQIVMLPRWFPFHMSKVAAWTRTMILPLALCSALQPVRRLGVDVDELFLDLTAKTRLAKKPDPEHTVCWRNFFLLGDRLLKGCRRLGFTPFRQRSIKQAERWIAARMTPETTEGLGAIFPPMVYAQIAFKWLGYPREHPLIAQAERDLDAFMIDQPHADPRLDHIRLQPCFSPVWDTAIALDALSEAGYRAASDERVAKACDWLRAREVTMVGDWHENLRREDRHLRPGVDTACWAFEYKNDWYPDVDDTCMVSKALWRVGDRAGETKNRDAARRGVRWVLAMQNDDGGWAAFDRTRDRAWMEAIPFADHNAMQDPSCSDITGRVMEALVQCGLERGHPALDRGLDYLLRTQQPEGCWWGRWGSNYIYGTWQAINGLRAWGAGGAGGAGGGGGAGGPGGSGDAGRGPVEDEVGAARARRRGAEAALVRARDWLLAHQNDDGGFGETANSYLDRSLMGRGPSTASQTAWGLLALMNTLPIDHPAITRAVAYLCGTQLVEDKVAFQGARTAAELVGLRTRDGGDPHASGHASRPDTSDPASPRAVPATAGVDPVSDLSGSWNEHWFTGTGFPKVFYLRYHYYRHSFPLKALAKYRWLSRGAGATPR